VIDKTPVISDFIIHFLLDLRQATVKMVACPTIENVSLMFMTRKMLFSEINVYFSLDSTQVNKCF